MIEQEIRDMEKLAQADVRQQYGLDESTDIGGVGSKGTYALHACILRPRTGRSPTVFSVQGPVRVGERRAPSATLSAASRRSSNRSCRM